MIRALSLSLLLAFSLAASPRAMAQPTAHPVITVHVTNVTTHTGNIRAGLWTGSWSGAPIATAEVAANADTLTIRLTAPAPGRYGVRLYQDLDGNNALNTNAIGIPTEPTGTSNNAPARMGPPTYADAAFDVGATGAQQAILLH